MAKMQSTIFNIIRGSIAGTTFLANPYAAIVARSRTIPTNPKTSYQTLIRSAFAQAEAAWKAMTEEMIEDWYAWGTTVTRQGPLGPYSPNARSLGIGQYALTRMLQVRELGGSPVPSMNPPVSAGELNIGTISVEKPSTNVTGFGIVVYNSTGEDVLVVATPSYVQNGTRLRFQGPWKSKDMIAFEATDGTVTIEDVDGYEDDDVVFWKIRAISETAPRRVSAQYIVRGIAETGNV